MKFLRSGLTVLLALVFTLVFTSLAPAQLDPKTEQMMEEVRQKSEGIDSYRVDMATETQMMGQTMTVNGEMAFKKPNKMHVTTITDVMGGMKTETYSTGDILWTYMPAMKMVQKLDLTKLRAVAPEQSGTAETSDITKPFEGFAKDSIKYIETKSADGMDVHVFEALPDKLGQSPQGKNMPQVLPNKIVLWINADNGLPQKVWMLNEDGSTMMEQTYSNFRLNVPIADSEFEFTPPEGAQVMDMTEATMNMMNQMKEGQPSGAR